jgi:carboxyl-terminal processing protease
MRGLLFILLLISAFAVSHPADTVLLKPKKFYGKEAKVISDLLDNFHFRKIGFTDSLSSVVLDAYLNELDPSKTYFLDTDIKSFEPFRYKIDDHINKENVDVAFSIYAVF